MDKLYRRAAVKFLQLPVLAAALVFLPAGTFRYWQGWVLTGLFTACSIALTVYLAKYDPGLLEARMNVGPAAEPEPRQKLIVGLALALFAALPVVAALDYRYGWSGVPPSVVLLGDALVALSFFGFFTVMRANSYSAATVRVAEGQRVASSGPYAVVRHPMYSWALVLTAGMSLALGSYWALVLLLPMLAVLVARIADEERLLAANLPGYAGYMARVPWRLMPSVW